MKYTIVIEKAGKNLSAYAPDMPGCVATGRTKTQVLARMRVALNMHIEGLREDGLPVPPPSAETAAVSVLGKIRKPGDSSLKRRKSA